MPRSSTQATEERVEYDALLVAVGARQVEPYEHVATFRDADADATYQGIVQDVEEGYSRSLAFIQPVGPVWPLPLYELALMTAERAESMDIRDLELVLVTPEARPLAVFGTAVSDVVSNRLERAGVRVYCNSLAKVPATRRLLIEPQGVELHPGADDHDAACRGTVDSRPGGRGAQGFIPIDKHCSVPGTGGRVFAAGDAANYPIKHGGLGAQMADAAAAAIAVLAGSQTKAPAFNPIIRGKLLTGSDPVYMSAHPVGPRASSRRSSTSRPGPRTRRSSQRSSGPTSRRSTPRTRSPAAGPVDPRRMGASPLFGHRRRAEMLVDELHGHRALAHRGRAALGRARADVAGREDAWHARLEQVLGVRAAPVRMKPFSSRPTVSPSHSVHGCAPRKRNRNENGRRSPPVRVTASSCPSAPCSAAISLRSRTATP